MGLSNDHLIAPFTVYVDGAKSWASADRKAAVQIALNAYRATGRRVTVVDANYELVVEYDQ